MFRYAVIDAAGIVVGESWLSGEVMEDNLIPIEETFDLSNKRYENGAWVEHIPAKIEEEPNPTQLDIIEANTSYIVMMMEA